MRLPRKREPLLILAVDCLDCGHRRILEGVPFIRRHNHVTRLDQGLRAAPRIVSPFLEQHKGHEIVTSAIDPFLTPLEQYAQRREHQQASRRK